jgi:hypothetical protein
MERDTQLTPQSDDGILERFLFISSELLERPGKNLRPDPESVLAAKSG